ncbi:uncharacterized protein LOC132267026 isoform X2 [Cornus florida]|uniref:uncharacterized protein LOC132267026 isoform X2 n=1 Tax=Cornus florida TaxID=4283 RepID=UPI002896EB34|nr:uncharacterized protein LOC132267026 isoform X2 [Cornus florida]
MGSGSFATYTTFCNSLSTHPLHVMPISSPFLHFGCPLQLDWSRQHTSFSTQQHQEQPITSQFQPGSSSHPPQDPLSQSDSLSQYASSESSFMSELTQLQSDFTTFSAWMGRRADDLERGVTDMRRDITQFRMEVQLTLTRFREEVTDMLQQLTKMIQPPPGGTP